MTLRDDARTGLLLAEGLGACARIAVDARVSEETYLKLARSLYRKLAGEPKPGRRSASHGAWDPLMRALRTQVRAAAELEVSRATLNRWLAGAEPDDEAKRRIARVARKLGVEGPYR